MNDLKTHLLEDADFNRSWADGRRGGMSHATTEFTQKRIAAAEERERWAKQIEKLEAAEAAARKAVAAFEALGKAQNAGALLMERGNCEAAMVALKAALFNTGDQR